ncbi:hypothetical protein B5M09_004588 [Aphanomyces astaci]|uniref:EF-hand domain-containing protein n=1 Tax=Aphanomyces astaci TaxID=112090 RepID=A0A3R7Z4J0_APHAT|nr:hypothetical protein B5M09_004588 [Aphanomyces astaci]
MGNSQGKATQTTDKAKPSATQLVSAGGPPAAAAPAPPSLTASSGASSAPVDDMGTQWKNREEAAAFGLQRFLQALHDHMPATDASKPERSLDDFLSDATTKINITDMYKGVHLDDTLTLQVLYPLRPHTCIDLHGQLDDLLLILRENGVPSAENPYVFNGDFVDRGKSSVEVCLVLFGFAILYPHAYDDEVFSLFCHCFRYLPVCQLGTVLQDRRVLILHGGVPRQNVKLHDLLDIPRFEFDGLRHTNKYMKATPRLTRRDKNMQIISDIVWSDPRVQPGFDESPRGAGIDFGPDITKRFMQTNRLALIVRSHECAPLGYAYPYGEKAGMLVTLFSASNYTKASNMGAIMHIPSGVNLPPSFAQYRASASDHDFVGSNLDGLYSVILDSRELLLSAFEAADVDGRGLVSAQVWQQLMESTLHMAVDWAALQPLVTSVEKDGSVAYVAFLDRYQASASMAAAGAMNNLYRHRERLEMLFHTIDKDGNGVITMDEFQAALDVLNQHLPRDMLPFEHPSQLMSVLDFTKDNAININEFLESFRLHANLTTAAKWRRAKNKLKAMHHLGMLKTYEAS